jgi:Helicase associated domain.
LRFVALLKVTNVITFEKNPSVDTKLADLVAQSTVNALTVAQQQGLFSSTNSTTTESLERALGRNNSNIQIQFGRQCKDSSNMVKNVLNNQARQMDSTHHESEGDGARRYTWDDRFEELRLYKEQHGHCNVPQVYERGLGTWVSQQRAQFKRFKSGKTSSMTTRRQQQLEKLGFVWSLRKRHSWGERYNELKAFSDANDGSCDVQNEGDFKALWTWCQKQRAAYRKSAEGKGPVIPKERVLKMEQIGFNWLLPVESVSISSTGSTSVSSSQISVDSPLSVELSHMD